MRKLLTWVCLLLLPLAAHAQRITGATGGGNTTPIPAIRPHTVVCVGDSILTNFCSVNVGSPLFYSLTTQPRDINIITYAVSGSKSGSYSGYTAVDGTDLNTPIMIAKTIAAAPDDILLVSGGNDSVTGYTASYANIKAFVQTVMASLPNVHFVLMTSPPQARGVSDASRVFMMRSQFFALHSAYPNNVIALPLEMYAVDDQTMHCPVGWLGGTAANCTGTVSNTANAGTNTDGQHPSGWLARNAAADFIALADNLRWPRISPTVVSRYDRYNASTLPGGSILGGLSVMYGSSSSGIGANMTGTTPQDDVSTFLTWAQSTNSTELTGVASTGGTLAYSGNTFRAAHVVLTATTTLTGDRKYSMARSGGVATIASVTPLRCSVLVSLASPVGINALEFTVTGNVNSVSTTYKMGSLPTVSGAQSDMPAGTYPMVMPNYMTFDSGSSINFSLNVYVRTGTAAGTVATIDVAQFVCTPVVAP